MQNIDWDIFRFVVAVADSGSAVRAAEVLGVDASTVQRRIIRFERDHGVTLFERQRSGYTPTAECAAIIDQARAMEAGVSDTIRSILGQDLRLEGRVTVATNETLAETLLPPHLVEFQRLNPAIEIDLNVSSQRVNLARMDADIAVRPSHNPPQNLTARRVGDLAVAVFASPSLGIAPAPLEALAKLETSWVGVMGPLEASSAFDVLSELISPEQIAMRADTFTAVKQLVIARVGLAVLPCCSPTAADGLVRLTLPLAGRSVPLWVLTHPDVRHSARVKALAQHLHEGLMADRAVLEGLDD
ncbi:LysR family transcriptional regulator [Ahrensia sp. R2A130]|uniref:LysR family transcriptional regulator n=1 Tax=Ahrensia sp. R2A130 TaxID=744979 RepID=UPI0001E0949E|nr:LysR family transcriptional regulator [Ahrensia sp. R2A130]EFL88354.1 transcriptional regulator [Ahrensia sp. R2A130]